jgi:hypothetical protein
MIWANFSKDTYGDERRQNLHVLSGTSFKLLIPDIRRYHDFDRAINNQERVKLSYRAFKRM